MLSKSHEIFICHQMKIALAETPENIFPKSKIPRSDTD
jgi:hypothetical protein